ncbi:MAG: AraC family transcriptional regulator [Pricia sp.]
MDNPTLKEGFLGQKMIVLPEKVRKWSAKNAVTRNFFITDIGLYPKAHRHLRTRKKGANEFIFIYCTEGEGWLRINDETFKVLPNHFFIIPKNTGHAYGSSEKSPWSIYWVHFDGYMAYNLYTRYYSICKSCNIIPFSSERIELFDQIYEIFKSNYVAPQMEYGNILGLNLISSFIFNEIDQTVNLHNRDSLVDNMVDFLIENLDKPLKSKNIAEEFNYSPSYLFSLFKKSTGYSLIQFFNLKKVQKACEYLNYTELSVKEISHRVGFQDPLYFSRLFKKYMGASPRSYKQEQHT